MRLAAILLVTCAQPAAAVVDMYGGVLTAFDFLATDETGSFYYDLFELANTGDGDETVTISVDPGVDLWPWVGWWPGQPFPLENWSDPVDIYALAGDFGPATGRGDSVSPSPFVIEVGEIVQIAVATNDYNEDGALFDSYTLSVDANTIRVTPLTAIPEPRQAAILLAGSCLALAGFLRWRRRVS